MGVPTCALEGAVHKYSAFERARNHQYIRLRIQYDTNKNYVIQLNINMGVPTSALERPAHKYTARPLMWVAHTACQVSIPDLSSIEIQ